MSLTRLGLKVKIAVGFGSLLAIIAVMGVIGYQSAVESVLLSGEMGREAAMKEQAHALQEAFLLERIGTRDVLMGRDNESTHLFEHGEADFRDAMEGLKPLIATDQDRDLYARVAAAALNYTHRNKAVVGMYRAGDKNGALSLFEDHEALLAVNALKDALNDMTAAFELQKQESLNRHVASDAWTERLMLILAVAGLAVGLGIAHLTASSIVRTIRRMLAQWIDIPYSQVKLDFYTFQGVSSSYHDGQREQQMNETAAVRGHVILRQSDAGGSTGSPLPAGERG